MVNLLFITVDELRYAPLYENEELREWKRKNLKAMTFLAKHGANFLQHYIGSCACAPSRATIHTGQLPSLHGVSQTDGCAKNSNDPDLWWVDEASTVPTWANFLEDTHRVYYKGKWHVSDASIHVPGTNNPVNSYDALGFPDPKTTEIYLKGDRLSKYGFKGWVGPEPHGSSSRNTGASASIGLSGRDVVYASEVIELLQRLDNDPDETPWAMVCSFVNPHDQAVYGEVTKNFPQFNWDVDPTLPYIPPCPTAKEDLSTKPDCQQSYKEIYQTAFQPTEDTLEYRQLYYTLQKKVDDQMSRVLKALGKTRFSRDTYVIFTSDHGDYLFAHGLVQKWYTAYQEAIHVPLAILGPGVKSGDRDFLTSHLDLVPTLLELLGVDVEAKTKQLQSRFLDIRPFVGRSLVPLLRHRSCRIPELPQYFMTDDNVTSGLNQINQNGIQYPAVIQPNSVETVLVRENGIFWKYSRYFCNPQFFYPPRQGAPTLEDVHEALKIPAQYEMYDLTNDPYEERNLANPKYSTHETRKIERKLGKLLIEQRKQKRLYPVSRPEIGLDHPELLKNRFPPAS
ncbi:MAG: sulfatase-like hydrolase/transferase [Nitrososphaerales archaeon]